MTDNLKIFRNSAILYLRLIITSLLALFSSRLIIHTLGASNFGLYSIVGGIVVMMAFLNTVMVSTTYRYIAFELGKGSVEGVNKIFNVSFVIHLCLAVIVVLLAVSLGEFYIKYCLNVNPNKVADALFVFRFSVAGTFFSIISIPFQGLVTAQENFIVQAVIDIFKSLMVLCIAVVLTYYLGNRLRLYSVFMALIMFLAWVLFFAYNKKKNRELIRWNFQKDKKIYDELLGFSGWIMLGAGASAGKVQGAALIINSFFGTVLNASFGIANQINSLVIVFYQNLSQAAIPQITKSFSSGNTDRTITLASYISKYSFFLMLIPSFPLLLEMDMLLKLWLRDVPEYTSVFCSLMLLNALLDCLGTGIPAVVQATGKIKYFQIILSTISLLSLPIAYLLFKFGFPPYSILITYIVTTFINVIIRQILLKKIINFDVRYFIKVSYQRILYVSILVFPIYFIRNLFQDNLPHLILFVLFSLSWLLFIVFQVGLEKREKEMLYSIIKNIKHRKFSH